MSLGLTHPLSWSQSKQKLALCFINYSDSPLTILCPLIVSSMCLPLQQDSMRILRKGAISEVQIPLNS